MQKFLPSHGKKLKDWILQYFFLVFNIFDNVLGPYKQIPQFSTGSWSVYVPFDQLLDIFSNQRLQWD